MDDGHEFTLEEQASTFVADHDGQATGAMHGLYERGARVLARYAWRFLPTGADAFRTVLVKSPRASLLDARYALGDEAAPVIAVCRRMTAHADGVHDELEVANLSPERTSLSLELEIATDAPEHDHVQVDDRILTLERISPDGADRRVVLAFDALGAARPDGADWELSLAPGERVQLDVRVHVIKPPAAASPAPPPPPARRRGA